MTKTAKPMKPEDWVNAVLYPSRQIDKEFAQVNVLMNDGRIITGIRISEDDSGIVLRSIAEPKPITIPHTSIDALVESKSSMMPDGLVRSLRNRQEFDDLMKYLFTLKDQTRADAKAAGR